MSRPPASRAEIFGWAMYDFANSSYTTVIITVVYAVVFPRVIVGDAPDFALGNLLWSLSLAASYGLVVLTLPVLGTMMDELGHRKAFLFGSTVVTVLATAALVLAAPGAVWLAMLLVVVSNWGFSVGESFVAAFLPDLGPPDALGRISGLAWGLGYIGGLCCTAVVLFGLGPAELDNWHRLRWIGPVTAGFFALASVPTFVWLRDRRPGRTLGGAGGFTRSLRTAARRGFGRLATTAREAGQLRDLATFLVSYFFAMAGLSIVVAFAFVYGDQVIGWSTRIQQFTFVVTQLSAAAGALAFGWLQGRIGDKTTYMLTLGVWVLAVLAIHGSPDITRVLGAAGVPATAEQVFVGVGGVAGLCLGATQSAGRTLVALFSPPDRVGEMFALWGVFAKLSAVVGLLAVGALQAWFGLRNAVLICGLFFAAALVVASAVDTARGRAAASRLT